MADIYQLEENDVAKYMKSHVKAVDGLLDFVHPVGSIYQSTNSTSPELLFGGTWERFGRGRVLVGVDETDTTLKTAGTSGGSTNPLTNHKHSFSGTTGSVALVQGTTDSADVKFQGATSGAGIKSQTHNHSFSGDTAYAGSDTEHKNWQPFITVYMWKRTA